MIKTTIAAKAKRQDRFRKADRLWKIWKLALVDLKYVESLSSVDINMGCWWYVSSEGRCNVCAAGAVIHCRFLPDRYNGNVGLSAVRANTAINPSKYRFGRNVRDKLFAINSLRVGHIQDAADYFCPVRSPQDGYLYKHLNRVIAAVKRPDVIGYHQNKELFWRYAKDLLKQLKKYDL